MSFLLRAAICVPMLTWACSSETTKSDGGGADATQQSPDAETTDSGAADASSEDAKNQDAGVQDVLIPDTTVPDTGVLLDCPVSPAGKLMLLEAALRNSVEMADIVRRTEIDPPTRGFSKRLIGLDEPNDAALSVAECTMPSTNLPVCGECPAPCPATEKCFMHNCTDVKKSKTEAWWTGAPFTYMADPSFNDAVKVEYLAEPRIEINYDASSATLTLQWSSSDQAKATLAQETVDISNTLRGTGTVNTTAGQNAREAVVFIEYPKISPTDELITMSVVIDLLGQLTAEVSAGLETLATLVPGQGPLPELQWVSRCED